MIFAQTRIKIILIVNFCKKIPLSVTGHEQGKYLLSDIKNIKSCFFINSGLFILLMPYNFFQ